MTVIGKITVFIFSYFPLFLVCDKSCDGCDGPSNGDCKQCNPGFKLNNTKCSRKYFISACIAGTRLSEIDTKWA